MALSMYLLPYKKFTFFLVAFFSKSFYGGTI